jgi:hypothetical protein
MDLQKWNCRQQSESFDLGAFTAREQRRTERLVRSAYEVGHTHSCFLVLPRAIRLGQIADVLGGFAV